MSVSTPSSALKPQSSASPLPDVIGLGGAIAGLAGGVAMAVVAALLSASMGQDIWQEPKRIAAIVYGLAALAALGFDWGRCWLAPAAPAGVGGIRRNLWDRHPSLAAPTSDFGTPVMAGLVYGLLIWLVAYFAVLPLLNPALLEVYPPAFIIQHVASGVVLGLVYMWLRPQPYHS